MKKKLDLSSLKTKWLFFKITILIVKLIFSYSYLLICTFLFYEITALIAESFIKLIWRQSLLFHRLCIKCITIQYI